MMSKIPVYMRSAIILCIGISAYIVQVLIMKVASGNYPIHQVLVFRTIMAIPIGAMIVYLSAEGLKSLK